MLTGQQIETIKDLRAKGWTSAQIAFDIDADWIEVVCQIDLIENDDIDFLHMCGDE
jgi:transcriptional regulator